jgi:RNA polymerase sigma-70 factor (ECF subfamily)
MEERITSLITAGEHREALGLLAEAHSRPVARFCAGLVGSHADGEELMQEAFLDAWQAMPRFRGESTARAWLFGIARRVCIRHLRRRDRRAGLRQRFAEDAGPGAVARLNGSAGSAGEDTAGQREEQRLLGQALAALKPDLQEAVLLRYQVGLDGAELAVALGIRPAAARKRVSLGLQALREAMRPVLMAPPTPADLAPPASAGARLRVVSGDAASSPS